MKLFTKHMMFLTLCCTLSLAVRAQNGTTDGTYDFRTGVGTPNSGGTGFKTQGDKFKVSNDFSFDGLNAIYDGVHEGSVFNNTINTEVIKAEGGTVCKTFKLVDMAFISYNTSGNNATTFDLFTITLSDIGGNTIATHSLASSITLAKYNGGSNTALSAFPFTVAWPTGGYSGVASISFTYRAPSAAPSTLNFMRMTLANISAVITSTTWNGTSWSNGAPDQTIDAVIDNNNSNTAGAFSCKNLTINAGDTLALASSVTASVYGTSIINNGATTGSGTLSIVGTSLTTLYGNGTYNNLFLNTTADATVGSTTADSLKITGVYTSTGTASSGAGQAIMTTGGKMVLKSTASATAVVGSFTFSSISGGLTVERFIPSNNRKKYVMVATPITNTTMYTSWQESGAATVGYGTQITGPTGSNLSTTGFDAVSSSGLASVFTYNDDNATGSKWVSVTDAKLAQNSYTKGFLLFVRGDRTVAPNSVATGNTVLRAKGSVISSGFSPNLTSTGANKFNLMGNAFPCTLDWTLMDKTGFSSSFTVYDPTLGVFVTSNGTDVSPSTSKQQAKYIQSGQAFFVQNGASGATFFNFSSTAKAPLANSAVNATVFGSQSTKPQLNVNVYDASNNEFADGVVAVFDNAYSKGIDTKDADKMENFAGETFAFTREGRSLSIESRPMVTGNDTLFFSMTTFAKKAYTLKIDGSNLTDIKTATLVDNYTNTKTQLDLTTSNDYTFTITSDAASAANSRFMLVLNRLSLQTTTDNNNIVVKLSPNPVSNQLIVNFPATNKKTVIKVINALAQVVKTVNVGSNTNNVQVDVSRLAAGTYSVQLLSGDDIITTQKIVKE